jgi:hypothetical protein
VLGQASPSFLLLRKEIRMPLHQLPPGSIREELKKLKKKEPKDDNG